MYNVFYVLFGKKLRKITRVDLRSMEESDTKYIYISEIFKIRQKGRAHEWRGRSMDPENLVHLI